MQCATVKRKEGTSCNRRVLIALDLMVGWDSGKLRIKVTFQTNDAIVTQSFVFLIAVKHPVYELWIKEPAAEAIHTLFNCCRRCNGKRRELASILTAIETEMWKGAHVVNLDGRDSKQQVAVDDATAQMMAGAARMTSPGCLVWGIKL